MSARILSKGDEAFTRKLMRSFGIRRLGLAWSDSRAKHPDLWVTLGKMPVITVTHEWARQKADARRSRILHEVLHILGLQHGRIGRYTYSTTPAKDSYSKAVYKQLRHATGLRGA